MIPEASPGPVYKPRQLINQHFSSTDASFAAGPFTTIPMAWSNVIYGGTASPNLAPFPISTPCRLVRWSSAVWYSVGGGTGGITLWTWNFFKNGAVVSQVPYFALPVGGTLVLAAGRPNVEFDLVPGTDHWGSEFVNPGGGGGIGVAVVRLCCTFEVL